MTNNGYGPKLKLPIKKNLQPYVYKCQFKNCCNFFTSISNTSMKYCQIHPRIHYTASFQK